MENLTNISVVKDILSKHGFTFSKALGQNFIVNPTICPKIAEMGNAKKGFGILEIGTGVGVLTNELAKRADKVVAVEIDSRLIPILDETLAEYNNVKIINDDIMKVNITQIIEENFNGMDVAICANLPYYITSPIIMMILEGKYPIKSITVMVQKEAGIRLCALPGTRECGAVSHAVRYYSEPELLFNVSRGNFMPSPNVDSCVIRLNIHNTPKIPVNNEKLFFQVIRGAFSQRRKTAANSISSALNIDKSIIINMLESINLSSTIRPEQMKTEDFAKITELIQQEKEKK